MHGQQPFPAEVAPRNVGNAEDVPLGLGETVVVSILRSETLPVDGRVLVVSLDEEFPFVPPTPGDTSLRFGRLKWRVGRRRQQADFDLKAGGTVFALSADWVEVLVVREFVPGEPESVRYEASISLSYGVPNLWPPTRTVVETVAGLATTNPIAIPHKAVAVRLTSPATVSATLSLEDGKGATVGTLQTFGGLSNPSIPLPLGQGARFFTFTNGSGFVQDMQAIFDLGF